MTSHLQLFVYGTLKPGESNFNRYCAKYLLDIHRAYIDGELYDFPSLGYPGAMAGNGRVHGFVLTFANAEILPDLDELEDYDSLRSTGENDYTRELVTAYIIDKSATISVWTYLMTRERIQSSGGILCPDGWWEGGKIPEVNQ